MHPPLAPSAWRAELKLRFERTDGRTVLRRRGQLGPLVLQKPLYPEGGAVCHGIVLHPPGGIAGGDRLAIEVEVAAGAHALLTTPGAAKWYGSIGPRAQQSLRLAVAAGAALEWLPQETIVFDGALADSTVEIELAEGARLAWWELVCLGRPAAGERFERGDWRQALRITRPGGAPLFVERGRLRGGDPLLASPVGLAGLPVLGTLLAAGEIDADTLARLRALPRPDGVTLGWTRLDGLVCLRGLAPQAEPLREAFAAAWQALRPQLLGRPPITPRIWRT
ncbi:urease accessory protein UreD [Chitinimonas koreensis]|uniref:urease accessory protein UreD n=1 Tax=Chitinimonas koreensis TaxID=356302 RepID=UPI00048B2D73|nr:urease accessory protein UreD [Chitinimonas koreensis]